MRDGGQGLHDGQGVRGPYRRAGEVAFVDPESLRPDGPTIENIRTMVERTAEFFEGQGCVTCVGPTFSGGYTETVDSGDGDHLTRDTIWDLKVMAKKPKTIHTLQLYMYYLMGKRSKKSVFDSVVRMGIFNPRLNVVYRLDATTISQETKDAVEREVIGYDD